MEAIFENCCGIDVHKKTLTACIMIGREGKITKKEIRTYSTMTEDIEGLRDWLKGEGVTHVAMESTGIYWRPVYNILEEGFEIMLVNARHIKNVPGRKTDVSDSEWLSRLLRNGLLCMPGRRSPLSMLPFHRDKVMSLEEKTDWGEDGSSPGWRDFLSSSLSPHRARGNKRFWVSDKPLPWHFYLPGMI